MEGKQAAARRALEEVEDGMLLGLGSGTTAAAFIDLLGARVKEGLRVTAVATSRASQDQAQGYGITTVESVDRDLDLTVDGADEIDPQLNLVKGLGGALLREKVVAAASRRMVVIATEDKLVPYLGRGPCRWRSYPCSGNTRPGRCRRLVSSRRCAGPGRGRRIR